MIPTKIAWLKGLALPAHWNESKVKFVAPSMQAGEGITAESIEPAGTYPVYGGNGLRGFTEAKTHQGIRILIGRQGALCGNIHLVSGEFWASEHAIVARAADGTDPRWLAQLLRVMNLGQYSQAAAQPGIGTAQINVLPIPVPPRTEQRAIADYLDRETARIDTLIEEQRRLIEMLRERRESVITRAVTRGLESEMPTKDTGIATLDHVPQHWQIVRIKNIGRALIGLTYSPEDVVDEGEGGSLVLRAGNIQNGQLALNDNVYVNAMIPSDLQLRVGDIVICARNGSPKLIGKNAVATDAVAGQTWGAFMVVLRSPINDYLRWILNSQIFRSQIGLFSTTTINQLTSATLHNLPFALPPTAEQERIAAYLEEQTSKIDVLIEETGRFIELSKERRSALITAAVTGQIDVREMV